MSTPDFRSHIRSLTGFYHTDVCINCVLHAQCNKLSCDIPAHGRPPRPSLLVLTTQYSSRLISIVVTSSNLILHLFLYSMARRTRSSYYIIIISFRCWLNSIPSLTVHVYTKTILVALYYALKLSLTIDTQNHLCWNIYHKKIISIMVIVTWTLSWLFCLLIRVWEPYYTYH